MVIAAAVSGIGALLLVGAACEAVAERVFRVRDLEVSVRSVRRRR